MKTAITLFIGLTLTSAAMASITICKESKKPEGKGYSAKFTPNQVEIFSDSKSVATLKFAKFEKAPTPDQYSHAFYGPANPNDYQLDVKTGGYAAISTAILNRGGNEGFQPVAKLDSCK